jgi:hypothetical protein
VTLLVEAAPEAAAICFKATTIYVDATAQGANDGSSWPDAYNHLQDALAAAQYSDEIRVSQGIYTPDSNSAEPNGSGDREATFRLIHGVTIKGGYAGISEPDPDVRDIQLYETILSGDLAGNDEPGIDPCDLSNHPSRAENSYHVVTGSGCDESAVLDGFTITGGNANSSYPDDSGGGMYNEYSSPTITNCTFSENSSDNSAGGMYNSVSNPTLNNCTFSGNWSYYGGGGMRNSLSSPKLTDCIFIGNSAVYYSGGMYNSYESNPNLANCTFIENSARFGGGMYNYESSSTMTNCIFSENTAHDNAGGMFNYMSSPRVTNCTFIANSTTLGLTGGIHNFDSDSKPKLTNCIIWGNTRDEINAYATVSYCDVQGGWGGEGNVDVEPCFANPENSDYHLKSQAGRWDPNSQSWVQDDVNSPCIDAGDPNSDWTAELWPHGERINMGAYGGTTEASMSLSDAGNIADLNGDGSIGYADFVQFIGKWLVEAALLAQDLDRDGFVNFADFAIFAHHFELPARYPNPYDGATGVSINADLSWTAGRGATSHDVYFGTSNPPPFILNQDDVTFKPGTMDYETTYYWRIDEINTTGTTTGAIWSFTTVMSPPP